MAPVISLEEERHQLEQELRVQEFSKKRRNARRRHLAINLLTLAIVLVGLLIAIWHTVRPQ